MHNAENYDNHDQLTQAAWDHATRKHMIPGPVTSEDAAEHFPKATRAALLMLARGHVNRIRVKNRQLPIPPTVEIPESIAEWIDDQIALVDKWSGNRGSATYKRIANAILVPLRSAESRIRDLDDDTL